MRGAMLGMVLALGLAVPAQAHEAIVAADVGVDLKRGEALYKKLCLVCHGPEGRGDGPVAEFLFPKPRDYTTMTLDSSHHTEEDHFGKITKGIPCTGMAGFAFLSEEERWALVAVVHELAKAKAPITKERKAHDLARDQLEPCPEGIVQPTSKTIVARKVSVPPPMDAVDPLWNEIPETTIPLMRLWWRKERIKEVSVRAVHDEKRIAIMLEWEVPTVNSDVLRPQDFTDAAAIMFSLFPKKPLSEQPHFSMGEKENPVNIWQWRYDRQQRLELRMDLAGRRDEEILSDMDQLDLRLRLGKEKVNSAVEDLNAEGFGTLTTQSEEDQNVTGQGIYEAGRCRVVFMRELSSEGPFDIKLKEGERYPIAFAVWDGSAKDRDGQKAITIWNVLKIEAEETR